MSKATTGGVVRALATAAAVVVGYTALVAVLTWPLPARLATHLPDTWPGTRGDTLLVAWALAHQSRALVETETTWGDGGIFHPTPDSLFYGDAAFGALPYFAPIFLVTGNPTLAVNLMFLGCIVLTACTLHFVAHRFTASHLAGVVAAGTFLATRWVLWTWIPAMPSYAVLQYLPLVILLGAMPMLGVGATVALAALVSLQALTSPYVAVASVLPLAVIAAWRLTRRGSRGAGVRVLAALAVVPVVWLTVHHPYWRVRAANPELTRQSLWRDVRFEPTPLPWGLFAEDAASAVPTVAIVLVVVGGLCALIGWLRTRQVTAPAAWLHGMLWTAIGLTASLPPTITWFGTPVRLPHAVLVEHVTALEMLRLPHRIAVAALMGLALLAGVAFAECARRLPSRARPLVALGLLALLYREYASGVRLPPVPPSGPLRTAYPTWRAVTLEPGLAESLARLPGPLLDVPVGPSVDGSPFMDALFPARAMYRAIEHRHPILNGYHGYWPLEFPERMALARRLPEHEALAALRCQTGLETIVVRPALFGAIERELCAGYAAAGRPRSRCGEDFGAQEREAWRALVAAGGRDDLALVARARGVAVFRVRGALDCAASAGAAPPRARLPRTS